MKLGYRGMGAVCCWLVACGGDPVATGGATDSSSGSTGGGSTSADTSTSGVTTVEPTTDPGSGGATGTTTSDTTTTTGTTADPTTGDDPSTGTSTTTTTTTTTDTSGTTEPPPVCGDGELDPGEECDDGDDNSDMAACTAACKSAICGDALLGPGEACDDGNQIDDDACTNACALPGCGDGIKQNGEECDDADKEDTDACLQTCVAATCGDGFVHDGVEQCDDANMNDADLCTACKLATCDDAIKNGAETDVDCGGDTCEGCSFGQMCTTSDDCAEGSCFGGKCVVPLGCKQLKQLEPAIPSGVYSIDPDGNGNGAPFDVYCEMVQGGGGWTLVAYNFGVPGTFLKSNYHPVNELTSPVTPTQGRERAFDPADKGMTYDELAFFTDDPQWSAPARDYRGFWIGDSAMSDYDLNSPLCQLLRRTDEQKQWNGQLVYHGGDGANDNGCIGGGSMFTANYRPSCDDGAGCVTVNASWPTNGGDPLWGWNYIAWHGGAPANNLYKQGPQQQMGLYAYYVR